MEGGLGKKEKKVYTIDDVVIFFITEFYGLDELQDLPSYQRARRHILSSSSRIRKILMEISEHQNYELAIEYFSDEIEKLESRSSRPAKSTLQKIEKLRGLRKALFH